MIQLTTHAECYFSKRIIAANEIKLLVYLGYVYANDAKDEMAIIREVHAITGLMHRFLLFSGNLNVLN